MRVRAARFALTLLPLLAFTTLAACNDAGGGPGDALSVDMASAPAFTVRGSVNQIFVTHAKPGLELAALDAAGKEQGRGTTDELGSLILRKLPAGLDYRVSTTTQSPALTVDKVTVYDVVGSLPVPSFYTSQTLQPGFNYITTRDGTTLSAFVALPGPIENGPYPTVMNYSGYDPSRPDKPIAGFEGLCKTIPVICDPPSDPSGLIAALLGYATVSVNIRGTGCSGGAYDYFETLESLDGYDAIEVVAAQKWVKFGMVGMTGLSYPGISQLFVARTRPPHLAAIAPMSVIGNVATTLFPGGILNDGFALEWVSRVVGRAGPYGQGWEKGRADMGDTICAENQLLHGQKVDNVKQARETPWYDPAIIDPLNPTVWAGEINVPVFLTGAFQDEQTGPFFTTLLDRFTGTSIRRFTLFNGVHPDGFAPQNIAEWKAFLDLFVARTKPSFTGLQKTIVPAMAQEVFHAQLALPPDRFEAFKGYDDALAAWKAEPQVRVVFENGTGAEGSPIGAPQGAFALSYDKWPPSVTAARRFYLQPDGTLGEAAPKAAAAAASFEIDPDAGHRINLAQGGDPWDLVPKWDWRPPAAGKGAVWDSAPLAEDVLFLGTSSVDLWVRSSADDADLQATLTELRGDGSEVFIQAGFLRASYRKLGPAATELFPDLSLLKEDIKPLVPGEWTSARIPVPASGHVLRKGSRLRLLIDTPGGSRSSWTFALKALPAGTRVAIGTDAVRPSSVASSTIPAYRAQTPMPPCPSLRGQPCRTAAPYANTPATP